MTEKEYLRAMECLKPDDGVRRRIAEAVEGKRKPGKRRPAKIRLRLTVLRPALVLSLTLLLAACVTGTAMAVSPQFRQAVLSFFHISEAEQVPAADESQKPSEGPTVIQTKIGGQVSAQYIRLEGPGYSTDNGAFYRVDRGEDGSVRSVGFFLAEDGVLRAEKARETSFDAFWGETEYQGTVYWCLHREGLSLYGRGSAEESGGEWQAVSVPGREDLCLLYLSRGFQIDYEVYPLLLDLDTGETRDLLAEAGAGGPALAFEYEWADDLSAAVVTCRDATDMTDDLLYYCDLSAGRTLPLEELTGQGADAAFFADSQFIILSRFTGDGLSCAAYDRASGETVPVLENAKRYDPAEEAPRGILLPGGPFGLDVAQDGSLRTLDLRTGNFTPVEGFVLSAEGTFLSNRSHTRFLYYASDSAADGLGISALGVLDLNEKTFTLLDRENYGALREVSVGWFDDDRIEILSGQRGADAIYLYGF